MGYAAKLGSASSGKLNIIELGSANSYNIGELYPSIASKVTIDNFFYRISNTSSYFTTGSNASSNGYCACHHDINYTNNIYNCTITIILSGTNVINKSINVNKINYMYYLD